MTLGDQNLILGLPWLEKHNPIVDWKDKTLEFQDSKQDKIKASLRSTYQRQYFTLPHASLWIQANFMESMWIPHGIQVKCPKKEIFMPECMESLWNPCGIHPHSRFIPCRVQKEVFSDYLHGIHGIHGICMDSTWIPHGFQATLSKRKNPKKSKKIL